MHIDEIRTRYMIAAWLFIPYILPLEQIIDVLGLPYTGAWWDATYYYIFYFVLAAFIFIPLIVCSPRWFNLFGEYPCPEARQDALEMGLLLWVLGIALGYLIFFPLSFVYPEFVSYWYLPYAPLVYYEERSILWVPTLINLVPLVVFAPVLEEVLFRGILLRRFFKKYGVSRAILFSSLIFGIAHPDTFGATAFGIGMCILYLRYGSLYLTIAVHAIWNALCFLIELIFVVIEGEEQYYTLEKFQADWPWGVLFLVISIVWVAIIIKMKRKKRRWSLRIA